MPTKSKEFTVYAYLKEELPVERNDVCDVSQCPVYGEDRGGESPMTTLCLHRHQDDDLVTCVDVNTQATVSCQYGIVETLIL